MYGRLGLDAAVGAPLGHAVERDDRNPVELLQRRAELRLDLLQPRLEDARIGVSEPASTP